MGSDKVAGYQNVYFLFKRDFVSSIFLDASFNSDKVIA